MKAVVDTSVLIAGGLAELPGELAISAVSLAEISFGVLVARDDGERASRLRLLTSLERAFDALPVDSVVASSYGQLAAAVARAGRQPGPRAPDPLIAANGARPRRPALHPQSAGPAQGRAPARRGASRLFLTPARAAWRTR